MKQSTGNRADYGVQPAEVLPVALIAAGGKANTASILGYRRRHGIAI
jgi:hypothetical protein